MKRVTLSASLASVLFLACSAAPGSGSTGPPGSTGDGSSNPPAGASPVAGAAASAAPGGSESGTAGPRLVAELGVVPTGVACVKLSLAGAKPISKTFTVTAGATASLDLGNVTPGSYVASGFAYDVACTSLKVTSHFTPETIPSLANAVEIAAGIYHACARFADGSVKC
jgi:hypothetical protein